MFEHVLYQKSIETKVHVSSLPASPFLQQVHRVFRRQYIDMKLDTEVTFRAFVDQEYLLLIPQGQYLLAGSGDQHVNPEAD